MTKLTPEQVEKLEAQVKERCESDARDFLGIRLHRDDMQAILTLCREWRVRGELVKEAYIEGLHHGVCSVTSNLSGDEFEWSDSTSYEILQGTETLAALKGADHEDT